MSEYVLNEKTKIPFIWAITAIATFILWTAGATLYIGDVRSETKITEVKVLTLEQRQTILEQDLKQDLRRLGEKIDQVIMNQNQPKRGN